MKKALYRRFRPLTFDKVLGQDSITGVLKNQVKSGTPGHAYLFSGGRGTGKTSCAKIFARAVNCLHPVDGNPCNECANCRAILEETTMDVVEMDAASNRGIDDIRELRDQVKYPPAQVKYKVYIIDEAHMITNEAFNALLKIMEEPPAHLIFILATTEEDKIPLTILSRLQRYEFKRLEPALIEQHLYEVGEEIQVTIEPDAARAIAREADGAMRDALSYLDQLVGAGTQQIDKALVDRILGTVESENLEELTALVFQEKISEALSLSQKILKEGKDASTLLREWIEYMRRLLLIKGLEGKEGYLDQSRESQERMTKLVEEVSLRRIADTLDLLMEGEGRMRKSDYGEALLESLVVQLIHRDSLRNWESRLRLVEEKLHLVEAWKKPENLVHAALLQELPHLLQGGGQVTLGKQELPSEPEKDKADRSAAPPSQTIHREEEKVPLTQPKDTPAGRTKSGASDGTSSPPQEQKEISQQEQKGPATASPEDQWPQIQEAFQRANLLPPVFLNSYERVEFFPGGLALYYPEEGPYLKLVGSMKDRLADLAQEVSGEPMEILVLSSREKRLRSGKMDSFKKPDLSSSPSSASPEREGAEVPVHDGTPGETEEAKTEPSKAPPADEPRAEETESDPERILRERIPASILEIQEAEKNRR